MKFPTFPTIIRTFYTFSNYSARNTTRYQALKPLSQATIYKSMPIIPFLSSFFSSSTDSSKMSYPVQKTDDEWQAVLSKEQFKVIRQKGTEAPFAGKYDKHMPDTGIYTCAACDAPLYKANQKFKSGCGWPAYFDNIPGAVTRHTDSTLGMERTEIVCTNCGGHLGHVFKGEGYATPTDERHCVNSISMKFHEEDKDAESESKA
ncbi:Peptide methionine sulfoxide reductase B3 [Hyphodiscus hymeniophilus]|uniref:Peptide-methionine (R)-S-oxide reductase n=1 Tax=Hyphodiscus hymeniophilus TaxID=353542 RepID=A0A9P6VDD4_9HELO|nr:Peptide methionine sulfoxide reductase B3 [Hyphodiscus hymeniophilus]